MTKTNMEIRNLLQLVIPIRITDEGQFTFQELVAFTVSHPEVVLIKEYKDPVNQLGVHYHGWAYKDKYPMITLRKHINDQLHCKGNEHYSFKKNKDECPSVVGYHRYCCKGTKEQEPIEFHNIKQELVRQYYQEYWEENKRLQETRKNEKDTFKTEMVTYFRQIGFTTEVQLITDIVGFYETKDKIYSENDINRYFHYIRGKLDPDYKKLFGNRMMNKWRYD